MAQDGDGSKEDRELLELLHQTFKDEACDFLIASEEILMKLEGCAEKAGLLAELFRHYHSIKGSAATVGCASIAALGHLAEDCLCLLRQEPSLVNERLVSLLLRVNDRLRRLIDDETETDDLDGLSEDLRSSIQDLETAIEAGVTETHPATPDRKTTMDSGPSPDAALKKPAPAQATNLLKIDSRRLDDVMDMVGELVVIKSQIIETLSSESFSSGRVDTLVSLLDKTVRDLHEKTLFMRMLTLKHTFLKLQRSVRDLSQNLGKKVNFIMHGEDTEIDRVLIDSLTDPLLHIVRNAIDHGIEGPQERLKFGKPEEACVEIKARRQGQHVVIEIRDDGRGINREHVLRKAKERGVVPEEIDDQSLADSEVFDLLFQPGFSTATEVTDVSGRGVGLDVVRANLHSLKGRVEVQSVLNRGTTFLVYVPLTTAITEGIIVEIGSRRYILPVDTVRLFADFGKQTVSPLKDGREMIDIGGQHYPLIRLGDFAGCSHQDNGLVVIAEASGQTCAFLVDNVVGKTQVVLKSLGSTLSSNELIAGASVMGDGTVALVFDVSGLLCAALERSALQSKAA